MKVLQRLFFHHIYCPQSKSLMGEGGGWGVDGVNGGVLSPRPP